MGITNQQIAESVQDAIRQMGETVDHAMTEIAKIAQAFSEAQDRRAEVYERTMAKLSAENRADHEEFRDAIAEMSVCLKLLQANQDRHDKNWARVWAIIVAVIVIPVGAAVISLVLHT